jgi:hypothetical protein
VADDGVLSQTKAPLVSTKPFLLATGRQQKLLHPQESNHHQEEDPHFDLSEYIDNFLRLE